MPARPPGFLTPFVSVIVLCAMLAPSTFANAVRTARPRSDRPETADWVPLTGTIKIGRTWGHKGGHGFPSIDFVIPAGQSVPVFAAGPGTVLIADEDCTDTTPEGLHTDCNEGHGNM